jgi:hypothetical protein
MAGRIYLNMAYVAPRAALWLLLFVAALVDGIRHRAVRSRGCAGRLGTRAAAATAGAAARFPTLFVAVCRSPRSLCSTAALWDLTTPFIPPPRL